MEVLKIALLGFIQGIAELLPISSTGHLILIGKFLEIPTTTLLLSVLHLGTTISIIIFFRKELFKNLFTKEKFNFYLKILVSSIPAGIIGVLFEDMIDEMIQEKLLRDKTKLSRKQIVEVLSYVECDEFLAKDIRNSIRNSIQGVLNH